MSTIRRLRAVRALGASLIAGVLALTGVGAAHGAVPPADDIDDLNGRTGSLTIQRYVLPDGKTAVTGSGQPGLDLGYEPLEGVTYDLYRLDAYDLGQLSGWQALQAAADQGDPCVPMTGPNTHKGMQSTSGQGAAVFGSMSIAAYCVVETLTSEQEARGLQEARPFLVTTPHYWPDKTGAARYQWDMTVYPKEPEGVALVETVVRDADARAWGDRVVWETSALVDDPAVQNVHVRQSYVRRDGETAEVKPVSAGIDTWISADGVKVADLTAADCQVSIPGGETQAELTMFPADPGIAKLRAAIADNPGKDVRVHLAVPTVPTVAFETITGQERHISAVSTANGLTRDAAGTSKWGGFDVLNVASDKKTPLAGAEFQVFRTEADAKVGERAIAIDGVDTWTADADGRAAVEGLRFSNHRDGRLILESSGLGASLAPVVGSWDNFHVVMTKASAGHVRHADPRAVSVVRNDRGVVELTYVTPAVGEDGTGDGSGGGTDPNGKRLVRTTSDDGLPLATTRSASAVAKTGFAAGMGALLALAFIGTGVLAKRGSRDD